MTQIKIEFENTSIDAVLNNSETADKIKKYISRDLKIKVVMGTWCSDSRENVPSFFKLIDYLNIKDKNIDLIGLDINKENLINAKNLN